MEKINVYTVGRVTSTSFDVYKTTTTFDGALDVYAEHNGSRPASVERTVLPDGSESWALDASSDGQGFVSKYTLTPPFETA